MLSDDRRFTVAPLANEIEITLIGPGYGESVLLHLGDARWIAVDSCVEPGNADPLPLRYLNQIGHGASALEMIVISHWDDDHIRGMSKLVDDAKNARVVLSTAFRSDDFIKFSENYRNTLTTVRSGTSQIAKVFEIISDRKSFEFVNGVSSLFHPNAHALSHGNKFELVSLSPSSDEYLQFLKWLSEAVLESDASVNVAVSSRRNYLSVALHATLGPESILLGADLEEDGTPTTGWSAVLSSLGWSKRKSSLFKVSHHGSSTGHHDGIWTDLLLDNALAITAPWRLAGRHLPEDGDVARIKSNTSLAYLSATRSPAQKFKRQAAVRKTIEERTINFGNVQAHPGMIRCRKIAGSSDAWQVELFGSATRL